MDVTYDPRCSMYKNGNTYYIMYWLPNDTKIYRSLGTNRKRQAKQRLLVKEAELLKGVFDERDVSRMPEKEVTKIVNLSLSTAVENYLLATRAGKKPKTHANDSSALRSLTKRLRREHPQDVTMGDIQLLVNDLWSEGLAQASMKTYKTTLHKFFEWCKDSGSVMGIENPVTKKVIIPEVNGLVRERLPLDSEIGAITADSCEIQSLITFIAWTGCRLGEALHLEWKDIENGLWSIKRKPQCPTKYGMGWSPKWGKPRFVYLFPKAIEVVESQSRVSRWVFPKPDGSRRDSLRRSWDSLKNRNGVKDLQIKDLRTWFNHKLKNEFGFTTKEASAYLGHSEEVNENHYDPISLELIQQKLNMVSRGGVVTRLTTNQLQASL